MNCYPTILEKFYGENKNLTLRNREETLQFIRELCIWNLTGLENLSPHGKCVYKNAQGTIGRYYSKNKETLEEFIVRNNRELSIWEAGLKKHSGMDIKSLIQQCPRKSHWIFVKPNYGWIAMYHIKKKKLSLRKRIETLNLIRELCELKLKKNRSTLEEKLFVIATLKVGELDINNYDKLHRFLFDHYWELYFWEIRLNSIYGESGIHELITECGYHYCH